MFVIVLRNCRCKLLKVSSAQGARLQTISVLHFLIFHSRQRRPIFFKIKNSLTVPYFRYVFEYYLLAGLNIII